MIQSSFSLPGQKYLQYVLKLFHNGWLKCLQRKLMLDWNCKHEFLNHITEQITTYTYYPSCHQVYDVAKAIIQKFPYFCEKIGSGYDGWYICIKDKLKNVRRKSDEPSATCRKKLKMSDKILTSVARKRSFPKASSNITKHLKEMEDAINDLEEQTPKGGCIWKMCNSYHVNPRDARREKWWYDQSIWCKFQNNLNLIILYPYSEGVDKVYWFSSICICLYHLLQLEDLRTHFKEVIHFIIQLYNYQCMESANW